MFALITLRVSESYNFLKIEPFFLEKKTVTFRMARRSQDSVIHRPERFTLRSDALSALSDRNTRSAPMRTGKIGGKILLVAGAVIVLAMPAMAGNGKGTSAGKGSGDRTRTQSRDGSCQDAIEQGTDGQLLVGVSDMIRIMFGQQNGDLERDQLQDGSCQG
jgi:hypothetical protein